MDTKMLIELFGYCGSLLVVVSMLMSSVIKLRVINTIGSVIFAIYALIIRSYPTALMNFFLVGINIYQLMRLRKTEVRFSMLDGKENPGLTDYFLNYYREDIQTFFPSFDRQKEYNAAYIVCCDTVPAGILIAQRSGAQLDIALDYSTPTYRDCSVGRYLYERLPEKGVSEALFRGENEKHVQYLQDMGFIRDNGIYRKKL